MPYNKREGKANDPLFAGLAKVSIVDVLNYADKECGFMSAFTHIKPHGSKSSVSAVEVNACLIANGTNLGINKMSDQCNINLNRMLGQMNNFIRSSTLKEANEIIVNAIADLPIFKHWNIHDDRLHGAVDGQKFGTRLQTFMSRYSAKYFGVGKGVTAYTLSANHVPIDARVISSNQHESHFLFDILYNNNSNIDPDWISGDGHSINQVNFLLLNMIDKQFAPHFSSPCIKTDNLCSFQKTSKHKDQLIKSKRKVKENLIKDEWDNVQRIMASLLLGETPQHVIVSKLSSYKHKNKTNTSSRN